ATHRSHAQVEDAVKTLKATGASYLPFHDFAANAAWLELALSAHDVMVWTQLLALDGEHRICEPKRLRYRILHVAGQLTRHARRTTLHLPADWPWPAPSPPPPTRPQAPPTPRCPAPRDPTMTTTHHSRPPTPPTPPPP